MACAVGRIEHPIVVVAPRRAIVVITDGLYDNGDRRRGQHGRLQVRTVQTVRVIHVIRLLGLIVVGVRIVVVVAVREGRGL